MRAVRDVMRRFWIVTLGAAVTALKLLGAGGGHARAGTGMDGVRASRADIESRCFIAPLHELMVGWIVVA